MRKLLATGSALAISLASFSALAEENPREKLLLVGDSLAEGMTNQFSKLAKNAGYRRDSAYRRGSTIDYWSRRIEEVVGSTTPSVVIVSLGTNDAIADDPASKRQHVKKIVSIVKSKGAKIEWILPPTLPATFRHQEEIRKMLKEELAPNEVYESTCCAIERSEDGIHATANGYSQWFLRVWNKLETDGLITRKD